MGYDFAKTGDPKKLWTFWGEEEQRNERVFRACTETSDMKFVTTRAKQRRGETPGQERHSGRTAKAFFTLSLLRAHFYTGVFHTSYVRSERQTDNNSEVVSVLPSLCSEQGAAPLALLCSYPADAPHLMRPLRVQNDFANHSVPTRLKTINTQRRLYGTHT